MSQSSSEPTKYNYLLMENTPKIEYTLEVASVMETRSNEKVILLDSRRWYRVGCRILGENCKQANLLARISLDLDKNRVNKWSTLHSGEHIFDVKFDESSDSEYKLTDNLNLTRLVWNSNSFEDSSNKLSFMIRFNCVSTQFPSSSGFLMHDCVPIRLLIETFSMDSGEMFDCSFGLLKLFWYGNSSKEYELERLEAIESGSPLSLFKSAILQSIKTTNEEEDKSADSQKVKMIFNATLPDDSKKFHNLEAEVTNSNESSNENIFSVNAENERSRKVLKVKKTTDNIFAASTSFNFTSSTFSTTFSSITTPSVSSSAPITSTTSSSTTFSTNVLFPNPNLRSTSLSASSKLKIDERKFVCILQVPAQYENEQSQTTISEVEAETANALQIRSVNYETQDAIRTYIRLGFIDCPFLRDRELEELNDWSLMNKGKSILDVDYEKSALSNRVYDINRPNVNSLEILWNPSEPITLALMINCPSCDFISMIDQTADDGAAPFVLSVETFQNTIGIMFDSVSCLVKVIKLKSEPKLNQTFDFGTVNTDKPKLGPTYQWTILKPTESFLQPTRFIVKHQSEYVIYATKDEKVYLCLKELEPTLEKLKNFLSPLLSDGYYSSRTINEIYHLKKPTIIDRDMKIQPVLIQNDQQVKQLFSSASAPIFKCAIKDSNANQSSNCNVILHQLN